MSAVCCTRFMETLEIIRAIEDEKRANSHAPPHATESELRNRNEDAVKELDILVRCGMITMGRTINSRYIHIKGNKY